jgi:hypothetical protein
MCQGRLRAAVSTRRRFLIESQGSAQMVVDGEGKALSVGKGEDEDRKADTGDRNPTRKQVGRPVKEHRHEEEAREESRSDVHEGPAVTFTRLKVEMAVRALLGDFVPSPEDGPDSASLASSPKTAFEYQPNDLHRMTPFKAQDPRSSMTG